MSQHRNDGSELCSICCESMTVVAVGHCNHTHTCALCAVRLRMCYNDKTCPFCKSFLKKVYLTKLPDRGEPQLSYASLCREKQFFTSFNRPSLGIFVDSRVVCEEKQLMHYLDGKMNVGCQLCDCGGDHCFDSFKTFRTHLRTHHNASVCGICFSANRYFPRELEIFTNPRQVQEHLETHPECLYCKQRYFGKDELYAHMSRKHWLCHLCHAQGNRHRYLEDSDHYAQHLRQEHFACNVQGCRESFIAFATAAELEEHNRTHHPTHHPRRPDQRHRRSQFTPIQLTNQRQTNQQQDASNFVGYNVIDDDVPPDEAQGTRQGAWDGASARRLFQNEESFPPLPTSGVNRTRNNATEIRAPTRELYTAKCNCGRIVKNLMLPTGQTIKLSCDEECERIKRRAQLADAFNINPVRYTGAFPQNSASSIAFSIDLVTWARTQPSFVKSLEEDLHEFVLTNSNQRLRFNNIKKDDRKLVVELVERYGLVGREDRNGGFVEVVKTPRCALPTQKLVHYATSLTLEEYQAQVDEALKFTLFFDQIPPRVNLDSMLKEWSGEYKVQFTSKTTAKVAFRCARSFNDASRALVGDTTNGVTITLPKHRNH